jgi:hypothetical protein
MRLSRRDVLAALAGAAVASKPGAAAVRDPVSLWRGGAVYGAGQCGSSRLITRGWTRGEVLDVGDVFTIEGVHQIDWPSLRPMEGLKRFVVTQRVVCCRSGLRSSRMATSRTAPAVLRTAPRSSGRDRAG